MNNQEKLKVGWYKKILWWKVVLYVVGGFFCVLLIVDLVVSLYLNFFCPDIDYFVIHYPWGDWHVKNYCNVMP